MSLDRQILAERAIAVERHLERVRRHLPAPPEHLAPGTLELDLWAQCASLQDPELGQPPEVLVACEQDQVVLGGEGRDPQIVGGDRRALGAELAV